MATLARKPCTWPGCPALAMGGRCDAHRKQVAAEIDKKRGSAHERGYSIAWRRAREGFLLKHPLCKSCQAAGHVQPAQVVDHIVPHRGDKDQFWQRDNWQPLCKRCHDRKTATEDGRWGQWPRGAV